jgi:hypothetical protein
MPLGEHIKCRHREGEAGVEIFPDAVHHLFEVADHGQHGKHQIPPDLVVKTQALDIAEVIL